MWKIRWCSAARGAMWLYDSLWRLLLWSRQGPVEAPGAQEKGFLYLQVSEERVVRHLPELRELPERPMGHVRLVLVSDTHERHGGLLLPPCDAVLHSGDLLACSSYATQRHAQQQLSDVGDWLRSCECRGRFVIAGNHDYWLQELGEEKVRQLLGEGVDYLEFSTGCFEVELGADCARVL